MRLLGCSRLTRDVASPRFRRLANCYFLLICVLMMIGTQNPDIFDSPLSPYSTLGPLVLVLTLTGTWRGVVLPLTDPRGVLTCARCALLCSCEGGRRGFEAVPGGQGG